MNDERDELLKVIGVGAVLVGAAYTVGRAVNPDDWLAGLVDVVGRLLEPRKPLPAREPGKLIVLEGGRRRRRRRAPRE